MDSNNSKAYRAFLSAVSILLVAMIVLLCVCLLFTVSNLFADNPLATNGAGCIDLIDRWTFEDGSKVPFSWYQTASVVPLDENGKVTLMTKIDEEIPQGYDLFFRADCPNVDVLCDGGLIYSYHSSMELTADKDMFREFFVHLPSLHPGNTLTVRLFSEDTDCIYFHLPCLGRGNGVRVHIFHACQSAVFIIILAILAMFVGTVVYFYHLAHGNSHPDLLLLILFSALSGFWIITDSGLGVLFFRYNIVLYFINYSLPLLLTVTYLLLVPMAVGKKLRGYSPMALTCLVLLLVSYLLHEADVITLRGMMPVFSIAMLVCLAVSTLEALRSLPRNLRYFKATSLMMLAVIAFTVAYYFINRKMQGTMIFRHALVVFVFVMLVVLLRGIHSMERQAKSSAKLLQEKQQAEAKMMLSQINSHFFYNTINTIRGLILSDADSAYKMTGDFGKYVRYRVNSASDTAHFSTFKEELRAIRAYADICAVRMNQNLTMQYEIENDSFLIPTLTVEPIVENAIKHGIYEGSGEGTVTVRAEKEDGFFKVTVEDNGCGFDPEQIDDSKGVGISNIRTRLSRYPGCSLSIESRPQEGTTVTILYPDNYGGAEDETDPC